MHLSRESTSASRRSTDHSKWVMVVGEWLEGEGIGDSVVALNGSVLTVEACTEWVPRGGEARLSSVETLSCVESIR